MAVLPKKKLCWNCEGNVSLSDETCPYCGVSVIPASLDGSNNSHSPPYQIGGPQEHVIPYPPYNTEQKSEDISEAGEQDANEADEEDVSVDEFKNILLSLLLLLAGSMFFLFGLTLVLFSHNGIFTLQWDSSYWFIYSILSVPLLFFGWRALLKLDNDK